MSFYAKCFPLAECCPQSSEACIACPNLVANMVINVTGVNCDCNYVGLNNRIMVPTWLNSKCEWNTTGISIEDECGYLCPGAPTLDLAVDGFCFISRETCRFCIQAAGGTLGAICPCIEVDFEACLDFIPQYTEYSYPPCFPTGVYSGTYTINRKFDATISGCDIPDACFEIGTIDITVSSG